LFAVGIVLKGGGLVADRASTGSAARS